MQQAVQSRPSSNGFGRRKFDRDTGTRPDNKLPPGKTNVGSFSNAGAGSFNGNKPGVCGNPSHDRFVYVTTCLIGHPVEVQVKNGSTYTGIFHSNDRDFAIVLKMARLTKEGSFKLQKFAPDFVVKGLLKTMIIPAKELVQVIAKGVAVTGNDIDDMQLEKCQDIMIDSSISQSSFVEGGRELGRWTPDEDDPECPELENIFDGTWNRHWDQFETNATLFGVKSTFDEELYTTKLERGPQMRERERAALRVAKEMADEETRDLHIAEERGIVHEDFDVDEETKFSSVYRVSNIGYEESEDIVSDSRNAETFGGSSDSLISKSFSDASRRKANDGTHASSSFSSQDGAQLPQPEAGRDLHQSGYSDHAIQFDGVSSIKGNQLRAQHDNKMSTVESAEKKNLTDASDNAQTSKLVGIQSSMSTEKMTSDKGGLSPSATAYAPSAGSKDQVQPDSLGESSETPGPGKMHAITQPGNLRGRPGSSAPSNSERAAAASTFSGPGLSPSSSMGSLPSEKSTLNPYAKEFKLNPNAKSFTPSQAPLRPTSPISDGSYYFPANASSVPQMHAVPMGIGIGPSFGGPQSVVYNPQATPMQSPQAYIHPNGPMYGQQMILGHPRQVLYMPSYPPDMQYKGRDF